MRKLAIAAVIGVTLGFAAAAAAQPAPVDPLFGESFETGIIGFGPNTTRVSAGASNAATAPIPLALTLSAPVASSTFIAIASSDPARLTVTGGGVTLATGQSSALVRVDTAVAGQGSVPVILTANLGARRSAGVRVETALNETDVAAEADFCNVQAPPSFTVSTGAAAPSVFGRLFEFGVTEAMGAPPGWYAEMGYARSGTDPRTLTGWTFITAAYNVQVVNNDEFQTTFAAPGLRGVYDYTYRFSNDNGASFTYCDLNGAGSNSGLTFEPGNLGIMTVTGGLVINEIDYDQPISDNNEFIEVWNSGTGPISLAGKRLVLINGSDTSTYLTIDLGAAGATLAGGQYLIVADVAVVSNPAALRISFINPIDNIQNGAPDGVALIDTETSTLIDAFSYEGAITAAAIAGLGVVNLVEGTVLPAATADSNSVAGALARLPNGTDSDNAASDWNFTASPTPGGANLP